MFGEFYANPRSTNGLKSYVRVRWMIDYLIYEFREVESQDEKARSPATACVSAHLSNAQDRTFHRRVLLFTQGTPRGKCITRRHTNNASGRGRRRRVTFKAAKGFAVVDSLAPLSRSDRLWLHVIDTALRFIITRCCASRFGNLEVSQAFPHCVS